jgi:hypothetical protein
MGRKVHRVHSVGRKVRMFRMAYKDRTVAGMLDKVHRARKSCKDHTVVDWVLAQDCQKARNSRDHRKQYLQ